MSRKNILVILEGQVDKIILGVMVLISLFLLGKYVIGNPYGAKVRIGGPERKVSPGEIDRKVNQEAEQLAELLEQPPSDEYKKYTVYDKRLLSNYTKRRECTLSEVAMDIGIPYPASAGVAIEEKRLYAVPAVPPLEKVARAVLRGVAEVPTEEVTPGTPYESAPTKLEDIDLVTVSGYFDLQRLYSNFQLSFAGPGLKSSWKDPRLATPILARIELQRRTKQPNGSFDDWSVVPRANNDMYKKLLEELPLSADQMQLGVAVLMSQYESQDVQLDILQPVPYLFGVSRVEWMPPDYLLETIQMLEKEKELQKRQLSEERRRLAEPERQGGARPSPTPRPVRTRPRPQQDVAPPVETPAMSTRKTERTLQDVQKDMQKNMLSKATRLENMRDSVLAWAHDDTAQPGETYEYRMRVGVFNPITGKDWFRKDQLEMKDKVVLWSDFSAPAEAVEIPKMLHVFPMETLVQKDGVKQVEGVKVEIAKYYMGRWQSHAFDVYPGQMIGYPADREVKEDKGLLTNQTLAPTFAAPVSMMGEVVDTKVDYTSGMTLVDIVKEFNWDSRPRRTDFYSMLYSRTDTLSQLAIGKSNWPKTLSDAYKAVQDAMTEEVEALSPYPDRSRYPEPGRTPERFPSENILGPS